MMEYDEKDKSVPYRPKTTSCSKSITKTIDGWRQNLYNNMMRQKKGGMNMDSRTELYAKSLSRLIQQKTVSYNGQTDKSVFYQFHDLLRQMFPNVFRICEFEDFDGSFLLHWKGESSTSPIMLMHHHDVVEAPGKWKYPPFSGEIAEGKIWGRGTLDTKGGLWAILQAAEELIESGFTPQNDIYFVSACTEETDGAGADQISLELLQRGIRFSLVLDEGGMIVQEPIAGANGSYAMIGLGEKGCADLKFIARSSGGHASRPEKNTPLVRLGKFMAATEKTSIFPVQISPTMCQMLKQISLTMKQPLRFILGHSNLFKSVLQAVIPAISSTAGAMMKTTLAFTMASGSEGTNVLPQEAWVIGNMRYSHHQGKDESIAAIRKLAAKYDIETVVLDPGFPSPVSDTISKAYQLIEQAVHTVFPDVISSPYLMTAASDCRFMSRVCDNCIRFAPFRISDTQMDSIHGLNENIDLSALAPAVDFYRYIMTEA